MDRRELLAEVGERIRLARKRKGYTQAQLGHMLGVSFQLVQAYEHGRQGCTVERLILIADCLGTDPAWFLEGEAVRKFLVANSDELHC